MILSAGAVGSPQTLMLSGVGDEVHLTEVGVQPVGENLSYDILSAIYPSTWLAYLSGGGPLTSSGACGGLAYVHTGVNNDSRPDIQYHMLEVSPATDHGFIIFKNFGLLRKAWPWFKDHTEKFSAMVLPTLLRPKSRGFVKLRSSNPDDHPVIHPNYLQEKKDMDTMLAAVNQPSSCSIQLLCNQLVLSCGDQNLSATICSSCLLPTGSAMSTTFHSLSTTLWVPAPWARCLMPDSR